MSTLNHSELLSVEELSAAELSQVVGGGGFKQKKLAAIKVGRHTARGASAGSGFGPAGMLAGGFIGFSYGMWENNRKPERKNRHTKGKR
jgi:hypothetical protein